MKLHLWILAAAVVQSFVGVGSVGAGAPKATPLTAQTAQPALNKLSEHLWIYPGPINVGILRDGRKALLIDCGDGSVAGRLGELGVKSVDLLIFTHHHRDQACGAPPFVAAGAKIGVPEAERGFFAAPHWTFEGRYGNLKYPNGPRFALAEALKVDAGYTDGQLLRWGTAEIRAISSPGHTGGSMSYEVNVDGKRVVFCGDSIYDEGQVWDLYSLNREYGPCGPTVANKQGTPIKYPILEWSDYEAFLGARLVLEQSLGRIKQARPERLVPSHGPIMDDPPKAIDALVTRLDRCFHKYIAISHLRWDFGDYYDACLDNTRKDYLPLWKDGRLVQGEWRHGAAIRAKSNPACLLHFGPTSWLLKSKDGPAFVVDCGQGMEKELQKKVQQGEITGVEGLWITHYHDDHVDGIGEFRKMFPACPIIADGRVAEVISDPVAWPPLPCLMEGKVRVDRVTKEGESWQWHEFKLTAYHFPGQTLYHGGLLAAAGDLRMLFVGDSLTAGGIEDYNSFNRNWLGQGVGYDRCLELVEKLQPTDLLYAHRGQSFAYTLEDCRFMRANLAERQKLFGEILPWDDPNYGMDGWWVMCRPWEQHAKAGGELAFDVVITNHSAVSRTATCRAVPPRAWGTPALLPASLADASDWPKAEIPPKTEGRVHLTLAVPAGVPPGRYVVPVDVRYGSRVLPQFAVALIIVDR